MQCRSIYTSTFMAAVYIKYSPLFFFITTLAIFFSAALTSHAIPFPSVKPKQQKLDLGT